MTIVSVSDDNGIEFLIDPTPLQGATVTGSSATQITLSIGSGAEIVVLSGTGFGSFDGSGMPTTGTLTGITATPQGQPTELTVTGFTMAISTFRNYVDTGNGDGFSATLLAGNDTFTGANADGDVFDLGLGDDTADGRGGSDTADYTRATSGVTVNLSTTTAQNTGGGGTDTLSNIENLTGSAFGDTLTGTSGFNVILGAGGDDVIKPLLGGGVFDGGSGFDTLDFNGVTTLGIQINLSQTSAQNTNVGALTITGIEVLVGSSGGDSFQGDSANNTFRGMDGNDNLQGRLGDDILDGGNGTDTVNYALASGGVTIDLRQSVQNTGPDGTDTFISIETVSGSPYNDVLTGDGGDNGLIGQGGNDLLAGLAGADTLNGLAGFDTAVYSVASSAATLTHNSDGTWTVATGADGTDTLFGVEVLNFTDHAVALINKLDYDGSGPADLMWRNTNGNLVEWLTGAGATYNFTNASQGIIDTSWQVAQVGDFNGDFKADILWRNTSGNTNVWLSNTGIGMTGFTGQGLGDISTAWKIQTTGDFNGDGKSDVVWRNDDGTVNIWNSNANVIGVPAYTGFTGQGFATIDNSWIIKGAGDFNGDGRDDILWWNTNGSVNIWLSDRVLGVVSFTGNNLGIIPTDWSIQGTGDFNGDGKADVLWRNASGAVNIWLSNSGAGFTGLTGTDLGVIDNAWTISKVGDFNGDAKSDIAWRHSPDGDVNIWMSNAGYGFLGLTGQDVGVVSSDWSII